MAKRIINKYEAQCGRIYLKHITELQHINKKTSNKKMTKHMTKQFIEEDIRMAKKYKNVYSKSLTIK